MKRMLSSLFKGFPKTAVSPRKDWCRCLDHAGDRLIEITNGSEGEFLKIGDRLQEIHLKAREMSQLSGVTAERLSGDTIVAEMEGLKRILRQIGDANDASLGGASTISLILDRLQEVHGHLESFDKIVRNLRVLCNLIRVESARLGNRHEGFAALGDDVQGLIGNVDSGSSTLRIRTEGIILSMADHLVLAQAFENSQQEKAKLILDQSGRSIREMEMRYDLSRRVIQDAATRWKQISGNVGEVVASLQFHDITRQRMEHVREALIELVAERRQRKGDPGRRSFPVWPLRRRNGSGYNGKSDTHEIMSRTAAACELQTVQLHHAREDLVGAVERIGRNLCRISSEIAVMSEDIRQAAGGSGDKEQTYFSELESSLSKLMEAIGEFAEMNRKMSASMQQVAHAVGEMATFIHDIQKVGVAMRVTALNACIHAAHIGDSGLALGVLADSIHHLALNTAGSIDIIFAHLAGIGAEAASLSRQGGRYDQARLESENGTLLDQVKALMKPLKRMDEELSDLLRRFDDDGVELQQGIEALAADVRLHDEMDQGIGEVLTSLKAVTDEMHAALPTGSGSAKAVAFDGLEARYTMDKEREIHLAVTAAAPTTATGGVQLLTEDGKDSARGGGTREGGESVPAATGDDGDLGDNVELF